MAACAGRHVSTRSMSTHHIVTTQYIEGTHRIVTFPIRPHVTLVASLLHGIIMTILLPTRVSCQSGSADYRQNF